MPVIQLSLQKVEINASGLLFEANPDLILNQMMYRLTGYVAFEDQQDYKYYTPTSWWQMFKQEYFPIWLLKRFPITRKETAITVKTIYPFLKTKLPPEIQGHKIMVLVNDAPLGSFVLGTDGMSPIEVKNQQYELKRELICEQSHPYCNKCHRPILIENYECQK